MTSSRISFLRFPLQPCLASRLPRVFRRPASSFSAIHEGLRRSEGTQPRTYALGQRGATGGRLQTRNATPLRSADRRRQESLEAPINFKIRKGKKDISTPPKVKPLSRKARFNDPNDSFGKKSLVYQLKSGQLDGSLAALEAAASRPSQARRADAKSPSDWSWDDASASGRPKGQGRARGISDGFRSQRDRTSPGGRWGERPGKHEIPRNTLIRRARDEALDFERGPRALGPSAVRRPLSEPRMESLPFTTAASVFLYGKSIVEEALKARRRKLYNLYIYNGSNRLSQQNDAFLTKLAKDANVPVTVMGERDQALLSKASMGRPHNGYILEASPLPQPPVTGLSALEALGHNGFRVMLDHQSAEDAEINGKDDFVLNRSVPPYKPFVLLLDQILDPGNLGAMLRTASFLGVSAVFISQRQSAGLTNVALKASSGASEVVPIYSVQHPAMFLLESQKAGWKVYAGVPETNSRIRHNQLRSHDVEQLDPLKDEPCMLVVGSEGEGLPQSIKGKVDFKVSIPNQAITPSSVDSLNVSVATALLASAFTKGQVAASNVFTPTPKEPVRSEEMGLW